MTRFLAKVWSRIRKAFAKTKDWLQRMTPDHATAVATVAQIFLVFGVAWLGYNQWREHNVLELEQQWNSNDNQIHRNRILDAYIGFDIANTRGDQRDVFVQKVSGRDMPAMLDFFAEVHSCIHSGLCDTGTACAMFAVNAKDMNGTFRRPLAIMRLKLASRSWGHAFDDVEQDCASFFQSGADRESNAVITRDNMTESEEILQRKMTLEMADRTSLTYDLLAQACERVADGDHTKSGCPYDASLATNMSDATAADTGK